MRDPHVEAVSTQLDELIDAYEQIQRQKKYHDFSDISLSVASQFVTAGIAAISRAAGEESDYARQVDRLLKDIPHHQLFGAIPIVAGTLKAVRQAVASGYLVSVRELIHADLFGDFLEMADYLLDEGYKDPAAVLTGGVLEGHLRKLCLKSGMPTEVTDASGKPRPKKAERMNSDLAGQEVYSKLDQKSVTAWLDLRNKAAHGQYDTYTREQVELMSQGVTDFLTRHGA